MIKYENNPSHEMQVAKDHHRPFITYTESDTFTNIHIHRNTVTSANIVCKVC